MLPIMSFFLYLYTSPWSFARRLLVRFETSDPCQLVHAFHSFNLSLLAQGIPPAGKDFLVDEAEGPAGKNIFGTLAPGMRFKTARQIRSNTRVPSPVSAFQYI